MKLRIDADLCSGQGRCWKFAPNVYGLDEAGFNVALGAELEVPPDEERNAMLGMKACPERAITLVPTERYDTDKPR